MTILPKCPDNVCGLPEFWILLANIGTLALTLAGGIAVIFILIGAFQYFTAYGNEEKAQKAKTTIIWALTGVVVIILSRLIVYVIQNLLM